ncbi:hypothetical protein CDV31_014790 [Fusarium ambrosium]|uniref:Uncharacterized protein n=1 Tax=Fusarium ambrosium TaxID=131363 RepID=A0A428SU09_9HYPO|nr:hypothetical protein CDV31_014790 [Fusarium ambrosium]
MSGLEILGAVASSIALAQAVQGTIKAIVTIDGFIIEAMRQTGLPLRPPPPPGTTQEHPMVSLAVQELEGVLEALNQIVSKYSNNRKWHDPRRITRKMQWLTESKKIEELARKAQNTKLNLHLAITLRTSSSVDRIGTQQEVILHSIKQHTIYYLEGSQQNQTGLLKGPLSGPVQASVLGPVEGRVEEIETEGDSCSETSEASAQSMTDSLQLGKFQSLSLADERGGCTVSIKEESYMSLTMIQPLGTRRCGQDCQCRCHGNIDEDDNYSWMSTVFGSWCVRNQTVDRTCEMQCGPSMGPEFEYRPPKWLWPGVIPFGSFQHGRPVLVCSLRAPRTICWDKNVWQWVKKPSYFQRCIKNGWTPFPDDADDAGEGFIERAMVDKAYESIEILLELWKNVLPQQGLSRRVGYYVNFTLVHRSWEVTDDKIRHVLAKTLAFAQGGRRIHRIHQAAKEGDTVQMRQALREQPEAIDELDSCGNAPIHYAVMYGNMDVLEQLILAGANPIRRAFDRYAPLMSAIMHCHKEATRILLQNDQCRRHVDLQENFGRTALHMAVGKASPECVHILLEAGASVEKRDLIGQTPLHYLVLSRADQQTAHRIIHLLQGQNARLDAQTNRSMTTLLQAVVENNAPVLRALVDAGASLNVISPSFGNILHFAACYAELEMMSYVAEQHLTLVDPRLCHDGGNTPLGNLGWCCELEDWELAGKCLRRPSPKEQQVFISLYFDLLSHYLLRHMAALKQLLRAARRKDASTASEHIGTLIKESDARNENYLASWYTGIRSYIKDENWLVVVEIVQDEMRETRGELGLAAIARDAPVWDPVVRKFFWE